VAFSVAREWQKKGVSKIILRKLAEVARENGISGLVAYTALSNKAMIALFRTLPHEVKTNAEDDLMRLSCLFNGPKREDAASGL
jgi:L-amino acid N-acyltransferase YncA